MDKSTTPLGQVIATALEDAGLSENAAAERTGIPRSTLKRHLADGDFKHSHLHRIAGLLGTTPAALLAQAEGRAA